MPNDAQLVDALRRELPAEAVRPVDIHLERQRSLTIKWADGHVSRFLLVFLRQKCPCATCRTPPPTMHSGESPARASGTSLTILPANFDRKAVATSATLVGHYAIQIHWADGHDTGIYDFRYLRAIDPE